MINLNLLGVVRCCRAAIPHLRRSSQGPAIVTIGSINALMALGSEPYSSAKAGLGALTLNLAAQLGAVRDPGQFDCSWHHPYACLG